MARVTYHGESFEVPDGDATLLDYYRGEGAEVDLDEAAVEDWLPRLFDGSEYIDAPAETEALPEGQAFVDDGTVRTFEPGQPVPDATGQVVDVATGEPVDGHPQPGPAPDPAA